METAPRLLQHVETKRKWRNSIHVLSRHGCNHHIVVWIHFHLQRVSSYDILSFVDSLQQRRCCYLFSQSETDSHHRASWQHGNSWRTLIPSHSLWGSLLSYNPSDPMMKLPWSDVGGSLWSEMLGWVPSSFC